MQVMKHNNVAFSNVKMIAVLMVALVSCSAMAEDKAWNSSFEKGIVSVGAGDPSRLHQGGQGDYAGGVPAEFSKEHGQTDAPATKTMSAEHQAYINGRAKEKQNNKSVSSNDKFAGNKPKADKSLPDAAPSTKKGKLSAPATDIEGTATGFSSTDRTLKEAFTGSQPPAPSTSVPAPEQHKGAMVAAEVGTPSITAPNVPAPNQHKGAMVAAEVGTPSITAPNVPAPNQHKGAMVAAEIGTPSIPNKAPVNVPGPIEAKIPSKVDAGATINVAAGSLKPNTPVAITDPATGKTKTVTAGTLPPSVQVAKPIVSAFVKAPRSIRSDHSANSRSEHGTGRGGDNAHNHAFGGHGYGHDNSKSEGFGGHSHFH